MYRNNMIIMLVATLGIAHIHGANIDDMGDIKHNHAAIRDGIQSIAHIHAANRDEINLGEFLLPAVDTERVVTAQRQEGNAVTVSLIGVLGYRYQSQDMQQDGDKCLDWIAKFAAYTMSKEVSTQLNLKKKVVVDEAMQGVVEVITSDDDFSKRKKFFEFISDEIDATDNEGRAVALSHVMASINRYVRKMKNGGWDKIFAMRAVCVAGDSMYDFAHNARYVVDKRECENGLLSLHGFEDPVTKETLIFLTEICTSTQDKKNALTAYLEKEPIGSVLYLDVARMRAYSRIYQQSKAQQEREAKGTTDA